MKDQTQDKLTEIALKEYPIKMEMQDAGGNIVDVNEDDRRVYFKGLIDASQSQEQDKLDAEEINAELLSPVAIEPVSKKPLSEITDEDVWSVLNIIYVSEYLKTKIKMIPLKNLEKKINSTTLSQQGENKEGER